MVYDSTNIDLRNHTIFLSVLNTIFLFAAGYGNFTILLAMYSSSAYSQMQTSFPVNVKLGEAIYFEARANSSDKDVKVLIEKCSASPTMDKNHPLSYTLIKDRSVLL